MRFPQVVRNVIVFRNVRYDHTRTLTDEQTDSPKQNAFDG